MNTQMILRLTRDTSEKRELSVSEQAEHTDLWSGEGMYLSRIVPAPPEETIDALAQTVQIWLDAALQMQRVHSADTKTEKSAEEYSSPVNLGELKLSEPQRNAANAIGTEIATLLQNIFAELASEPSMYPQIVAQICKTVIRNLKTTQETAPLAEYFQQVLTSEVGRRLVREMEKVHRIRRAHDAIGEIASATDDFDSLRGIAALYGYLHSSALLGTNMFTRMVNHILVDYAQDSLGILMLVAVDILSRGFFTRFPSGWLPQWQLWTNVMTFVESDQERCLWHPSGDGKEEEIRMQALHSLRDFVKRFIRLGKLIEYDGREVYGSMPFRNGPPEEGTKELVQLEGFCARFEDLLEERVRRLTSEV